MKKVFYPLLIIHFFSIFSYANNFTNQITIKQKEIETTSNFRIGDIFRSLPGFGFSTVDGFIYQFSINGLNTFQKQNYSLFVNDHEISPDLLGIKNINSLPVNINNIDSVVIHISPWLYNGNFENNGIIRIYSSQPDKKKYYFKNKLVLGNESKDAGPFSFTKYTSPNVDKLGSDYSGSMGIRFKDLLLSANVLLRQNIYTDWAISNRFQKTSLNATWPRFIEYGGSINIQGRVLNTSYSLFLSRVYGDRLYYYFEPAGREIPLDYYDNNLGLRLKNRVGPNLHLRSSIKYELESTYNRPSKHIQTNPWNLESYDMNLELQNRNINLNTFGVGLEYKNLFQEKIIHQQYIPRIYLTLNYKSRFLGELRISELLKFYNQRIYDSYILCGKKNIAENNSLTYNFSYAKEILNLNSYWYWTNRGTIFHNTNIIADQNDPENIKYTGDLIYSRKIENNLTFEIGLLARYFQNYFVRNQIFSIEENLTFSSPSINYNIVDGFVKGLRTKLQWRQSKNLDCSLNFTLMDYKSKDNLFTNIWDKVPQKIINYKMLFTPNSTLSLWFNLHYSASTIWHEYRQITGYNYFSTYREDFIYSHKLDAISRMEVKIKKYLLDRTLAVNLHLRNLSNQRIFYHPVGASFDMSMYLGIEYNF